MISVDVDVTIDKDASGGIKRAQRNRLEDGMDLIFANSQELVPEDRGTLRQSGFQPVWENGKLKTGYRAQHALPMEYGTQPFWAPIEPLKEWAERVVGDAGFGYYVQQKIAEEGIDAQPYMRPSVEKGKQWFRSNSFGKYLDREL